MNGIQILKMYKRRNFFLDIKRYKSKKVDHWVHNNVQNFFFSFILLTLTFSVQTTK